MESKKEIVTGGLSLQWTLTIIFIVLKLCNLINWSWWWVFSPIWISIGLGIALILLALVFMLVVLIIDSM